MEATASPTKRRVLGPLDPNASPRPTRHDGKQGSQAPNSPLKKMTVFSASASQPEQVKRPLLFGEVAGELLRPAKKVCQEEDSSSRRDMAADQSPAPDRRQSGSPEPSLLFDNSAVDTSQATTITEPDVAGITAAAAAAISTLGPVPRSATRPRLTREEAREKGEILKLRLGLASYKLRTGQTDIPLEQLELQSLARHRHAQRARNVGWASSRLQAQLQLQRAQLAAHSSSSAGSSNDPGEAGRLPAVAAAAATPALRPSSRDAEVEVDASFSSQVQWSQGSSQEGSGAGVADGETGEVQGAAAEARREYGQEWSQQQQMFRVEVAEGDRLSSSALRGGEAASGLLSLAHARS